MIYNSVDAKNINTDIFPALENYFHHIRYVPDLPQIKRREPGSWLPEVDEMREFWNLNPFKIFFWLLNRTSWLQDQLECPWTNSPAPGC